LPNHPCPRAGSGPIRVDGKALDATIIQEAADGDGDNTGATDVDLSPAGSGVKLVEQARWKGNLDSAYYLGILRLADGHRSNVCQKRILARFDFRALPDFGRDANCRQPFIRPSLVVLKIKDRTVSQRFARLSTIGWKADLNTPSS
jgi:hypothetical protein